MKTRWLRPPPLIVLLSALVLAAPSRAQEIPTAEPHEVGKIGRAHV